jgi:TM2 domain-containing membrane protein YozV
MALLQNWLIGIMVFSLIITAFAYVATDMNKNYGQSHSNGMLQGGQYLDAISNMTANVTSQLNPEDIAQAGSSSFLNQVFSGGKIVANVFSVILFGLPGLAIYVIQVSFSTLGVPAWIFGYIRGIVYLVIVCGLIYFILWRRP